MSIRIDVACHPYTATLIRQKALLLCLRSDFSRSDEEDLTQEMVMFLWQKAEAFDAARGNLEAFITMALGSWVKMELRRRRAVKRSAGYRALSLEGTLFEHNGECDSLGGLIDDADGRRRIRREVTSFMDRQDQLEEFREVDALLSDSDRKLLRSVIDDGISCVARNRGVSRRQIGKLIHAIRTRILESRTGDQQSA